MIKVDQRKLMNLGLLISGACATAALVLISNRALLYIGATLGVAVLLTYVLAAFVSGNSQGLVPIWALLYPLGYYFLSFPMDHPIFTFDRAFVAVLAAVLVVRSLQHPHFRPLPKNMFYAGLSWVGFLLIALISLRDVRGHGLLYSVRLLNDTFVMPGILAYYVLRRFDLRRQLAALGVVVSVMSIYLAGIGMAEDILRRDLLSFTPENVAMLGNTEMFRANGPFESGSTYGLVGVINFLLLRFLTSIQPPGLPSWQRILQRIGTFSAFLVSLIPMHRGIVVTWVVIGLIEAWQHRTNPAWWKHTAWKRIGLFVLFGLGVIVIKVASPYIYQDRFEDASNIQARLAQHQQSLAVLADNLWLGAGFGQFTQVVEDETKYQFFYQGVPSINYPHNTLLNVATETGLLGLSLFVVSQIFLVAACRQLLLKPGKNLAWWTFISVFVSYWVFGMDVSIGYLSELNMWYMFALAICIRYAWTDSSSSRSERADVRAGIAPLVHSYSIPN